MKNTHKWALVVVVIVVIVGLFLFNKKGTQTENVKIGGLFGLTGFASFTGEDSRDGFLLAIEDYGKPVNYVIEDFHSDIKGVITSATKLIDIDKVSVVIGPEWNEFGEAVTTVANAKKVPFISPWAATEQDWVKSPYYFSATPSERPHTRKIIEYMVAQGVKTIALLNTNNAWSLENMSVFKDELSKTSIKVVAEFKFNPDQRDFRTELLSLKGKNPDAIYAPIAAGNQTGPIFKQIKELGITSQLYAPESIGQDTVLRKDFGTYMEKLVYYIPKKYKNVGIFVEKFEKRFGRKPATRSGATAYDMTTLVLKAIDEGAKTPEEIKKYLENVKNYEGYSNLITFNEFGQLVTEEVELLQIVDGKDVLVK